MARIIGSSRAQQDPGTAIAHPCFSLEIRSAPSMPLPRPLKKRSSPPNYKLAVRDQDTMRTNQHCANRDPAGHRVWAARSRTRSTSGRQHIQRWGWSQVVQVRQGLRLAIRVSPTPRGRCGYLPKTPKPAQIGPAVRVIAHQPACMTKKVLDEVSM